MIKFLFLALFERQKSHKQVLMSFLINCTLWYFSFLNIYNEKKRVYHDDDDTIIQEISARLSMRESFEFVLYCINDFWSNLSYLTTIRFLLQHPTTRSHPSWVYFKFVFKFLPLMCICVSRCVFKSMPQKLKWQYFWNTYFRFCKFTFMVCIS